MNSYAFHPEAFADLDEIWEYIAEDGAHSDPDRGDGFEGTHKCFPVGGLQATRYAGASVPLAIPDRFTLPSDSLESRAGST